MNVRQGTEGILPCDRKNVKKHMGIVINGCCFYIKPDYG